MVKTLKFYCQKVLPLVYDDSLSYYELLCKVVHKVNELVNEDAELEKAISEIYGKLTNVEVAVNSEVTKILTQWKNDGTLEEVIGSVLGGQPFVPTGDIRADYKRDTLNCVASYLTPTYGVDSIIGEPNNIPTKICYVYNQVKTYRQLMRGAKNPVFTDTLNVDGGDRTVVYLDCSTFLSLLTRCRPFTNSPFYYAITQPNWSYNNMLNRCLEYGGVEKRPYTFDNLNYINTAAMAYNMLTSGNQLFKAASVSNGEVIIDRNVVNNMETGDLVFFGDISENPDRFYGIYHCMYYLKSLGDLDESLAYYGVRCKPYDDIYDGEMGYVVHVTGSPDYQNVMRVESLHNLCKKIETNGEALVYTCKPYSNALNSSKAWRQRCLMQPFTDFAAIGDKQDTDRNAYFDRNGVFTMTNLALKGQTLPDDCDFNNLEDGFYDSVTGQSQNSWLNKPSWVGGSDHVYLFQFGLTQGNSHKIQLLYTVAGKWGYRVVARGNPNWGAWYGFTGVADGAEVLTE